MFEHDDMPSYHYDDGGRAQAGYKGSTGDCSVRAIAIATGKPYDEVYKALHHIARNWKGRSKRAQRTRAQPSPRNGVFVEVLDAYMKSIGWVQHMVKARINDLPAWAYTQIAEGTPGVVLYVRKHYTALVNETVRDTWDCRMTAAREDDNGDIVPPQPKFVTRIWAPEPK